MILEYVKDSKLKVIVKPNSKSNEVLNYDEEKQALKVAIKEPADKNKANRELIKFISKETDKKVRIKSGNASKEKILEFS